MTPAKSLLGQTGAQALRTGLSHPNPALNWTWTLDSWLLRTTVSVASWSCLTGCLKDAKPFGALDQVLA